MSYRMYFSKKNIINVFDFLQSQRIVNKAANSEDPKTNITDCYFNQCYDIHSIPGVSL